jgi:hypothetical protein
MVRAIVLSMLVMSLAVSVAAESLDGVWQSLGYGNVYEIHGPVLHTFEVTTRTCVAGLTAKRLIGAVPQQEAIFKTPAGKTLVISTGSDDDYKLLKYSDSWTNLGINRLPRMPPVCDSLTGNTPSGNFDVFTRTFAEYYIAFDLRHLDWAKAVSDNRKKVTARTTPTELFQILDQMIKPLGDLHTGIEAPKLKRESQDVFRAGTDRLINSGINNFAGKGRHTLFAVTDRGYLRGPLETFCNGQIQFGHVNDEIGYLRILSFDGYSKHGGNRQALETALDRIFSNPMLHALVIDVRLAFGGDDRLALAIASRLTRVEYMAFAIRARADPWERDKWTAPDPIFVQPSSRAAFLGRAVLLIGPITMSAAETFTQALMSRGPRIIRIGENTQGVFCDPLDRHLPNGWTFSLPNAVYRTAQGTAFDVQGIPPDIDAPVFADEDVAAGRDPAMALAIQILNYK